MSQFNGIDFAMIAIAGFVGIGFFIGYSREIGNRLRRGYAFAMLGLTGLMASTAVYVVAMHLSLPQVVLWALPALSSLLVFGGGLIHYMVSIRTWFNNRKAVKSAKKGDYDNLKDVEVLFSQTN